MKLDCSKDQHFLVDEEIIECMILEANINFKDVVLDIGAGTGHIARRMVGLAKKVIAIEKDDHFEKELCHIKGLVVEIKDVFYFFHKKITFNKIVSNIPFQLCEPLMRVLCEKCFEVSVLIVPLSFSVTLLKHPLFSAFFTIEKIVDVPKTAFFPIPRVKSVMIRLRKKEGLEGYFVRQLYLQRDKKLKNALREMVIRYYDMSGRKVSKKEAATLLLKLKIPALWWERKVESMPVRNYGVLGGEMEKVFS